MTDRLHDTRVHEQVAAPRRRTAPAPPGPVPALLLTLQRQAGNRATTMAVQRWWEPAKDSPLPTPDLSPMHTKQEAFWRQNKKAPKGVYRFVDKHGHLWEAKGGQGKFVRSDLSASTPEDAPNEAVLPNEAKGEEAKQPERAKLPEHEEESKEVSEPEEVKKPTGHWYDLTESSRGWKRGDPPPTHRLAAPAERRIFKDPRRFEKAWKERGFSSAEDVPMYVKMRYRLTAKSGGSKKTSSSTQKKERAPELRAEDRIARILYSQLGLLSSPHLAVGIVGGEVHVAGNKGDRYVKEEERQAADKALDDVLSGKPISADKGLHKDAVKLVALMAGDYQAVHSEHAHELGEVRDALRLRSRWSNVGASGEAKYSEHGEMTVLGDLLLDMEKNPGDPKRPVTVPLGGVKLACKACVFALGVANRFIAEPLGYVVKASGSHGELFPNWRIPDWLWDHKDARAAMLKMTLPPGWKFDGRVLTGPYKAPGGQNPEDSDSDWEEVV